VVTADARILGADLKPLSRLRQARADLESFKWGFVKFIAVCGIFSALAVYNGFRSFAPFNWLYLSGFIAWVFAMAVVGSLVVSKQMRDYDDNDYRR
jgi:hypothetical protein